MSSFYKGEINCRPASPADGNQPACHRGMPPPRGTRSQSPQRRADEGSRLFVVRQQARAIDHGQIHIGPQRAEGRCWASGVILAERPPEQMHWVGQGS